MEGEAHPERCGGNFLVGTYRTMLDAPIQDMRDTDYDELISTEVMACDNDNFSTLRAVEKRKGKVVLDETRTDNKIDRVQTPNGTIDGQLCELNQRKSVSSRVTSNPSYSPNPSS